MHLDEFDKFVDNLLTNYNKPVILATYNKAFWLCIKLCSDTNHPGLTSNCAYQDLVLVTLVDQAVVTCLRRCKHLYLHWVLVLAKLSLELFLVWLAV